MAQIYQLVIKAVQVVQLITLLKIKLPKEIG